MGTGSANDPAAAAAQAREIVGLYRTLRRHLGRGSRAELARSGLTAPQLSVVSLLGSRGSMTVSEVARELELSHSTVSGIVDRLHAKGVVERTPLPGDRRYSSISIAERIDADGSAVRSDEGPISRLETALASAPVDERQRITDGLALLCRFVEASAESASDRHR